MLAVRLAASCVALHLGWAALAQAQEDSFITPTPDIRLPSQPDAEDADDAEEWSKDQIVGRPVYRIDVVSRGERWKGIAPVHRVQLGEPYSGEVARRAMRELLDTGYFANATAEVQPDTQGIRLILYVEPRRVVRQVSLVGSPIAQDTLLEAARLQNGMEVGENDLPALTQRLRQLLAWHGFSSANVRLETSDTENQQETDLTFLVDPGAPNLVELRTFIVSPQPVSTALSSLLNGYGVQLGERADEEQLERADHELERELRRQGWHRAVIAHQVGKQGLATRLNVVVQAGAFVSIAFEGQRNFDADTLTATLELDANEDLSPGGLAERIKSFYVKRGYLDVQVKYRIDGIGTQNERLAFIVREQTRVRVVGREYPCLTGPRTPASIGDEIDSYLSEDLPGADILGPVDPARVDSAIGPHSPTGARPQPPDINPWTT